MTFSGPKASAAMHGDDGGIDAAGEGDEGALEAALMRVVAQAEDEGGVDVGGRLGGGRSARRGNVAAG